MEAKNLQSTLLKAKTLLVEEYQVPVHIGDFIIKGKVDFLGSQHHF